ncbi:hypothetical protein ACFY4C_16710 [Actinomadura viridis]|uniref:hypothetical protein n=1 Tax=Actinomadura viridis TaxID=58110 RepID=UPI0036BBAA8B
MLPRSAGKPIFIGLGTAAILAAGAAQVQAEPSPAPSDDLKPALDVTIVPADQEVKAGTAVRILADVRALNGAAKAVKVVSITASGEGVDPSLTGECVKGCTLEEGELPAEEGKSAPVPPSVLTVPKDIKKQVPVTVTLLVAAENTEDRTAVTKVTYTPLVTPTPTPTPTKTPTPTPTKSPTKKPTPTPTPTKSSPSDDDDNDSSGGGNGSGSGGGSSYTPPAPNGSFNTPSVPQNPQLGLPSIAPPSPSVAPQVTPSPESRLRNNKTPVAQDLTFERMASTQIAWLAALLVAFSLLMTQLRLGRRRDYVGARSAAAARRAKGIHRRPRRGLFGK